MIDLHLHLDGSLSPGLAAALAREQGLALAEGEIKARLGVPQNCGSLEDYLSCFQLPVQLLQSREALARAGYDLARRLGDQGLLYSEIRFAPQLHTQRGLSQSQAVEAVWSGVTQAMGEREGFSAQLILCCMRGGEEAANWETFQAAQRFLGQGVCALDLAGAEASYPVENYRALFTQAREAGVPFTLHAGEADGPWSVWGALELGASRIGHGVRAIEAPSLVEELARRQVPLELCPTSNLQTRAVASLTDYPVREYLRRGLRATLNTDNMTVSRTTLREEYEKLDLTLRERDQLLENAVAASFLPPAAEAVLGQRVRERRGLWLPCPADNEGGCDLT